ncbi:MAG: hypothetical protein ACREBV_05835, partial [Candidatus Zixiibacteriota bacterium]
GVYNILSKFLNSNYRISINGQSEEKIEALLGTTPMSQQSRAVVKGWLAQAEKDKFRPVEAEPGETVRLETELRKFFGNLN